MKKNRAKDRFSSGESSGVICLSKNKNFSDETTFVQSVLPKSHVLIKLGRKNS